MIDITIYQDLINQKKGLLTNYINYPTSIDKFRLEKMTNLNFDGWALYSKENADGVESYRINSTDDLSYLTFYCKEILNINFESILIGGLGIGILPYIIKNNCNIVDVIEINSSLINLIQSFSYLNGVNIVNENLYTYTPNRNYDIILIDIWFSDDQYNFENDVLDLVNKYKPYLNTNGFIYVPIYKNKNPNLIIYTK